MFNGVSDGSLIIIIILIFTGVVGNTWWAVDACDGTWLRIPTITILNRGQLANIIVSCIATSGSVMR